uniref:ELYS beta-propeller domain-containing protein n=1 Tax=Panagrolaimus superbus TaxID=310955 RepID=A0A914YT43_9BILA
MSIKYHQKCYQSPSKVVKTLPTSTAAFQGYEKGSFFTYRGEDTGYFYTATGDRLSIFQSNGYIEDATLSFTIPFGSTANIIDCIYFPLNETSPGLVVAVYDSALTQLKHKFYLAYVSLTKKRVLKKVAAPGQVNSLANIIDGSQYPAQVHGLNEAFQRNWPHIIGVSIYESGAALTHLAMKSEDEEHGEHCHKATNVIILGKGFLVGDDSFLFKDDQGRECKGGRSNFYVSKFAFIERCAIVVMGFPFGGIFMVSLRTQRPYAFFMAEGVIEDCAIQDADDDPRGFFYLWFALSRGDKAHALSAYAIFPEEDEKRKCYDNPQFVFSINFTLTDFMSFLSLKTMHVDRSRLAGSPKDNDASINESIVSNNKSSSLALFTWLSSTKPTRVYGALFDLNMYYFKRTPSRITPDDTELRQIPFCSGFQTNDSVDIKNMEIFDIVMMPNSLHAFVSVDNEDKDQLFYPSVYSFSLKSLTRKKALYLTVDSIQDQFLKEVSMNFVEHWSNPSNSCTKFHALGIGALPYESNDKRFYQLSTLLKHGYHLCISDFILNDSTSVADLKFLLKWLNKEVEVNKENLDRFCKPLLDGGEVSHTALHFIKFSEYFFYRICLLIDALIERVQKLEQEDIFLQHLRVASSVANGIHLYSIGIKFGIANKMLPQYPRCLELNNDLKNVFNDQMLKNNKATLSILRIIQECMESAPDSSIWENKAPQMWYPPQGYSTWLGIFLMINLSKTAKIILFGYYLFDLIKKGLCQDNKLLDKGLGYFLSDSDKLLAIKRRIEKMHKSDEMIAKAGTDNILDQVVNDMENPQKEIPKNLNDYCNLPLMNQNQIDIAKEYFLKLKHGVHFWNNSVLEKRRYELILSTDPPSNDEPKEVEEIRKKVNQLQRSKPWLFKKNHLMSVVKEWIDESTSLKESTVSQKIDVKDISISRKRTIDEVITAEEDVFPLATPIKQGRKSMFADTPAAKAFKEFENGISPCENDSTMSPVVNKDMDNNLMTDKQWERIKQITKTPPATPLVSRLQVSPEPSAVKQPTSILKSNKKQSRITPSTKRVRLQFDDNLSQIKSIPNRHEQKTPVPDVFTMEDSSIISEIEHQQIEDDDSINEADISYGPVKLNFDAIDDEDVDVEGSKLATVEEDVNMPRDEVNGEKVLTSSFEEQDEIDDDKILTCSFEKQDEEDDDDLMIRSFEIQDEEDYEIANVVTVEEEVTKVVTVEKEIIEIVTVEEEITKIITVEEESHEYDVPIKRARKTPSRENSVEAQDVRKSPRLRKSSVNSEDHHLPKSQPVKSIESTADVPELPSHRRVRKTPSRETSVEAPEVRKSPRKSSVNIAEQYITETQPSSLSSYAEEWRQQHRRVAPVKRERKTLSRENSLEAPDMRKSTRLRKSSVDSEEHHLSKSQPVRSMESIAEVPEPSSPRRVRKTPSRENSVEAPDLRKSPRLRKSSINSEDHHLIKAQPVRSMESIAEVPEPRRVLRKTPSRENSVEVPDLRKSPRLRKSSVNSEDHHLSKSQPAKSMESIAEQPQTPRGRGRPKKL